MKKNGIKFTISFNSPVALAVSLTDPLIKDNVSDPAYIPGAAAGLYFGFIRNKNRQEYRGEEYDV